MPPPDGYVDLKKQVDELLSAIGQFLVEATQGQHGDVDIEDGTSLIDGQLQRFWRQYHLLHNSTRDQQLQVAVLALTKSGKSTLLNALTSTECLPMCNVPETARICKIVHTAFAEARGASAEPWLQEPGGRPPVRGERAIRARLAQLNGDVRAHGSHGEQQQASDEQLLHIHTPIAALREYDSAGLPSLALLDTPGPNEAGEEGLRFQVDRLLDSVDAVVYILDYTKLKTVEEADLFRRLKQINLQLVKRLSQRLFFVVNKFDAAEVSDGMDADETRAYVSALVTQQLACEGFQLQPEQVLLVSARNALLARLVLSGSASDDVVRRFSRVAFGMALNPRTVITQEQVGEAANTMLADSGVADLEAKVLTFLYAHSAGVKLIATLDNVQRLLSEVLNVAVSCRACLRTNVEELQGQTDVMRSKLQTTLDSFDDVLVSTDAVQSEVSDEIRSHLASLRARLVSHIIQTLETADPAAPRLSAVAAFSPSRAPRRWQLVRDKVLAMFTAPLGGNGAAAAKSRSREELQKLLADLHEDLMTQIHVDVSEFWHVLEACTGARHAVLVRQINASLATLSRQVEAAVCSGLDVQLQAVDISMPMPSAVEFHSDLQQLISKGIIETQEKHLRCGQTQYEERVLRWRQGFCQWGTYWEVTPRTRSVVETFRVTVYEMQADKVAQHFIDLVDNAMDATGRSLSSYVRTFVRAQVDTARTNIEQYSERYLSAMSAALEANHRGVEARAAALAATERHLEHLGSLTTTAAQLQERVELMVPQLQDAVPYDELSDDEFSTPDAAASALHAELAEQPAASSAAPPAAAAVDSSSIVSHPAATATATQLLQDDDMPDLYYDDSDICSSQGRVDDYSNGAGSEVGNGEEAADETDSVLSDKEVEEVRAAAVAAAAAAAAAGDGSTCSSISDLSREASVHSSMPGLMLESGETEDEEEEEGETEHEDRGSSLDAEEPRTIAPRDWRALASYARQSSLDADTAAAAVVAPAPALPAVAAPGGAAAATAAAAPAEAAAAAEADEEEAVPELADLLESLSPRSLWEVEDEEAEAQGGPAGLTRLSAAALAALAAPDAVGASGGVVGQEEGGGSASVWAASSVTSGRFDYTTGFVRAMSTSAMVAAEEAKAKAAADEWTLLDENGSSAASDAGGDGEAHTPSSSSQPSSAV